MGSSCLVGANDVLIGSEKVFVLGVELQAVDEKVLEKAVVEAARNVNHFRVVAK